MKIYTVIEADYEIILNIYSFKTRGDAEEFILSSAEEYALNLFNSDIAYAPVPAGLIFCLIGKTELPLNIRALIAMA